MANIIDMQDLRYLNLFRKVTGISTRFCFHYNDAVFFCVPGKLISKAIGQDAKNIKKISYTIKKRVKVVPIPNEVKDARKFIESIVSPVTFQNLEVNDGEMILTAGNQSKAALIGRNKRRLNEMQSIVENFFKKEFKIV